MNLFVCFVFFCDWLQIENKIFFHVFALFHCCEKEWFRSWDQKLFAPLCCCFLLLFSAFPMVIAFN